MFEEKYSGTVDRYMGSSIVVTPFQPSPLLDAEALVVWMNAAITQDRDSYGRIQVIFEGLRTFGNHLALYQQQREKLEASIHKGKRRASLRSLGMACTETWKRAQKVHRILTEAFSDYTFHPAVGYTAIWDARQAGFVSVAKEGFFVVKHGDSTLSEADAAMAAVRLYLAGELARIGTCQNCGRWRVIAKSTYKYCSVECRLTSYAKDARFRERKKRNQQRYRNRLKRQQRAQDTAWSK